MRDQLSWLEHLPYKQGVGGSNPSFRTTLRSWFHMPTQIKQFLRCRYPQILGVGQKGEAQAHWTCAGYGDTKCRCSITASTTACQAVGVGSIPITCSRVVRKNQVRTRCDVRSQYHLRNKNEAIVTADITPTRQIWWLQFSWLERQIVALEVACSNHVSHPIDRHSKFIFYKNAYFGIKNCYCKFRLVFLCPNSSIGQSMRLLPAMLGVRVPFGVPYVALAQLDRALDYESRGREFESLMRRQLRKTFLIFLKKYDIIYM